MNYRDLLEHSFAVESEDRERGEISRLEYLAGHIFDFTTYDSEIDELFAAKAVEVCSAITNRTTFGHIKEPENYKWYLLMCNMPFFEGRLSWGTSIRGAWWEAGIGREMELKSCGLWEGDKQMLSIKLTPVEWESFIRAVIEFAAPEMAKEAA